MNLKTEPNTFIETIFKKKCGKLVIDGIRPENEWDPSDFQEKVEALKSGYDFIECILPGEALCLATLLFELKFVLVCVQPIFEKSLKNFHYQEVKNIRLAKPSDSQEISQVAGDSFRYDRYNQDQRILKVYTKELYSQWIQNSLSGRADFVLTAGGGFTSCKLMRKEGWIELIAVSPNKRRKGLGRNLVLASLLRLKEMGCVCCKVKTELLNLDGIRLYEGLGFKLHNSHIALHWHRDA